MSRPLVCKCVLGEMVVAMVRSVSGLALSICLLAPAGSGTSSPEMSRSKVARIQAQFPALGALARGVRAEAAYSGSLGIRAGQLVAWVTSRLDFESDRIIAHLSATRGLQVSRLMPKN